MPAFPIPRRRLAALAFTVLAATSAAGCGGGSLMLAPAQYVDPAKLDADPVSILPPGILMFGYMDAGALFRSNLGGDVGQLVQALLPLGPESNFSASRDVTRIFAGAYAMQGADFCAVVQGNFDPDAIRRSADARAAAPGSSLVKVRYAEADLYVTGSIGFTVLTAHTALSGNETGLRRALDRIRRGKLDRAVPEWMTNLGRTPNAAFSVAGDLSDQSPASAVLQGMPFLSGANTLRLVGNFQAPAMNVAGSMTFNDEASAEASAGALQSIGSLSGFLGLLSAIGLGITIPPIQAARSGKDVGFTVAIDEGTARTLLRKSGDTLRSSMQPGGQR